MLIFAKLLALNNITLKCCSNSIAIIFSALEAANNLQ